MLDFNNLLAALSLFSRSHCSRKPCSRSSAKGLKTLTSKNARSPLCKKPRVVTSKRASSEELALLVKTSPVKVWRCGSTSKIMVYVHEKGCEQVSHVVMPPMDKSTFYTRHCMINVESLAARTSIWEVHVLQCPAVPKVERIVEFPFVQVEVLWLNGNVVNQLKAPFIFAR